MTGRGHRAVFVVVFRVRRARATSTIHEEWPEGLVPESKAAELFVHDRGERERGCGRPITDGTTHGTNPSAAAESALPEGD